MKKKILSLLMMVVLAIPLSFGLSGLTAYAEDGDYIEIRTIEDLYNVRNDLTANYKLMNDIDLSETSVEGSIYNLQNRGWTPIGGNIDFLIGEDFTGTFDGNGHTLSNLTIRGTSTNDTFNAKTYSIYAGLFSNNAGIIKNLHLKDCDIYASKTGHTGSGSNPPLLPTVRVGGIAAENTGTIIGCSFDGKCEAWVEGATNSSVLSWGTAYSAGIAAYNRGYISECYNMGTITAISKHGSNWNQYYATCAGIVAGSDSGTVENCYNIGEVGGSDRTSYDIAAAANCCYSTKSYVKGSGFIDSYTLFDSSGKKSTLEVSQLTDKKWYIGFDFDNIWTIETATDYKYPQLRNNMMDAAKHVDIIEWKTQPTKIDFYTDEDIDPTGGVFTAYYIDDTHEDIEVTKDMLSGYDMTQLGVQTVTVTFREGTLTYDILTSTRPEVMSMTLESMPDKTEFARGTAFDFTGATAKVEYVNGKTEIIPITAEETTGGNIEQSGTYTITFEKFGKTVTFEVKVVPVKPTGIKITSLPDKTTYIEGQSLDLTGLVVKLEYNSGKTETITDYTVGEYENTVGKKDISITYENFSTSFQVEFVEKNLTAIMVTTQPTKAKYVAGEAFDPTGMVVKAVYDNGMSEEITDYTVSELTDATGWQTLTVSYEGKTTTIKVMVEAKELVAIFVSQMPQKTTYIEGETFDPEGMVVMANYNDVLTEEITDYTLSGTTLNKVGESKITVLYEGMTATFNVTVVEKKLVKITVTPPAKTEYIAGESFDETGMVVQALYDNGKSEKVTDYTVSGFGDTEEDNVVTIEYGGKTSAFIVIIHTPEDSWTITQDPTCTEGGVQELHCANCGKVIKTENLDALGHNWGEWETVASPSCIDKGSQKRVCSRCNVEEFKDVDPTGHTWVEEYEVDLAPTCTLEGSESWHCSECGISDPNHTRVIEKLPHNIGEWTTTKEATCAVPGVRQRGCADCDYLETEEIPATGNHTFGEWATVKEPTCTEKGSKSRECSVCHLVETEEIAALDHQWNTEYTIDVPATESAPGSKSIHCSVCNAVKEGSTEVIPQLTPSTPAVTPAAPAAPAEIFDLPALKISKPTAGKKKITVKWKKVSKANLKKISGIQIQVATDPGFSNIVKTATAGNKKTSKAIKGLQSKTKYYVRIRAYAAGDHVSVWKSKSVKVK